MISIFSVGAIILSATVVWQEGCVARGGLAWHRDGGKGVEETSPSKSACIWHKMDGLVSVLISVWNDNVV